ncbi:Flagellar motor switch protein FliN [Buchnera aphidicola (Cinara cuneomaculata)]|uniref:Flagellar motor switch protein FliN n=1 Tax=Buchnera aphidicola (Cinara cuneomaculata) TaxID=1660040 RepID=A0A451CXQ4_9GAMM|nr:flagellar motor switch protein FliN [Buchnera aphidicola]VFP78033.1 Flagellar motor switch protein FliN [Buchnera aphidicola (Cinara cuneomaculata)]
MSTKELLNQEIQSKDLNKKIIDQSMMTDLSIMSIPVLITIELGKKKITIRELLQLSCGSILELEEAVDEPLNIFVNNFLIALGELVMHKEKYGIRITKLLHK